MTAWGSEELYLTNIAASATDAELKAAFTPFGTAKECVFVSKRSDGKASQAAVVRMTSHAEALAAKKGLSGTMFKQRTLNVKWSNSQRVLWVGHLHESVTNEVMDAAFSQFGNVQRAVVVADTTQNVVVSKRYGFVVFENKRDAQKALTRCYEAPLLIGPTFKPVRIAYAHSEDHDSGFSEAAKAGFGKPAPKDKIEPATASRFATPGSRDFILAARMAELYHEYQVLRAQLRQRLTDSESQLLVTGIAPALSTAGPVALPPPQPQVSGPPPGLPPQHGVRPPLAAGAPPPDVYMQQQMQRTPPPLTLKRDAEEFHHVALPKRVAVRSAPSAAVPLPAAPPHAPRTNSFIRGGELHTVSQQEQAANAAAATTAAASAAAASATSHGTGEVHSDVLTGVLAPPGVKPPGAHDHKGIGFGGEAPAVSPPTSTYTLHMPAYNIPPPQQQQQQQQPYSYTAQQQNGMVPPPGAPPGHYVWQPDSYQPPPAQVPPLQPTQQQQPPPPQQQTQYVQQTQPQQLTQYVQQPPPQQPQQQYYQPSPLAAIAQQTQASPQQQVSPYGSYTQQQQQQQPPQVQQQQPLPVQQQPPLPQSGLYRPAFIAQLPQQQTPPIQQYGQPLPQYAQQAAVRPYF